MPDLIRQLETMSGVEPSVGPDPSVIRSRARRRTRRRLRLAAAPLVLLAAVVAVNPWRTSTTSIVSDGPASQPAPAVSSSQASTSTALYDTPQPVPPAERADWDKVTSVLGPGLTANEPVRIAPDTGQIVSVSGAPFRISLVLEHLDQPHQPSGPPAGTHQYTDGGESILIGVGENSRVHYISPSRDDMLVLNLGTTLVDAETYLGDLVALMPRLYDAAAAPDG